MSALYIFSVYFYRRHLEDSFLSFYILADVNIAEGEPCRMSYDSSDGKLCASPNLCTTCTSVHASEGTCTSPCKSTLTAMTDT